MSLKRIVVLGPSFGRRIQAFREAANRRGIKDVHILGYARFARDPSSLDALLEPGTWLRFESPDEDPSAFRALYNAGASAADSLGYPVLNDQAMEMACKAAAVGSPAQLAFGLQELTGHAATLARVRGACMSADPAEIALCYDKRACSAHLSEHGIAVPSVLDQPTGFDAVMNTLCSVPGRRIFLKFNHGAGAAGTIALAQGPRGQLAAYTALILEQGMLFATKRVRRRSDHDQIRDLVDALVPLDLHTERWLPKAGVGGKSGDPRFVATRSGPPFPVLRLSNTPMTNLHLDAERAPAERLLARMQPTAVEAVYATSAKAMQAFPGAAMLGLDIAVHADLARHSVLEVNAFGDHVRNVLIRGDTPQDRQIHDVQQRMAHAHWRTKLSGQP